MHQHPFLNPGRNHGDPAQKRVHEAIDHPTTPNHPPADPEARGPRRSQTPGRNHGEPAQPRVHEAIDHPTTPNHPPASPEARGPRRSQTPGRNHGEPAQPRVHEAIDGEGVSVESIAAALAECRSRSLRYTDIDDAELVHQHSPLMSPLVWDLAHVGNYEELWLLRALTGAAELRPGIDELYDAFRHPRSTRPALPLLSPAQARTYIAEVRDRALDALAAWDADALAPAGAGWAGGAGWGGADGADGVRRRERLLTGGFVYGMVVQHEHQHDETMLATHQLRAGVPLLDGMAGMSGVNSANSANGVNSANRANDANSANGAGVLPVGRPVPTPEVFVPAGEFVMGTSHDPWAYDNERPAHRVYVPAFWIDVLPVSNAAHIAFIEAGGYDDERLWSRRGWQWRCAEGVSAPRFWHREGGEWVRRRFGRDEPVPPGEPVQHVCWHEAQAHATWAGRRLPSEAEWEKACAYDPVSGRSRRFPWGDEVPRPELANLGHAATRPAPLGAYPAGASAYGVEQMIGDVWEWTASDFAGYPGFVAFPYREYSEVFFPRAGHGGGTGAGRGPGTGGAAGTGAGAGTGGAAGAGTDAGGVRVGEPAGAEAHLGPRHDQYKVLRGGSWATHPSAVRATFRNWDHPIRRQIFAGFRLARDASAAAASASASGGRWEG